MKKLILPLIVFFGGLSIAHYFFGLDIEGLIDGMFEFIGDILDGPG